MKQISKGVIVRKDEGECLIRITLEGKGSGLHLYATLKKLRQENCYNFEPRLIYVASTRPASMYLLFQHLVDKCRWISI